MDDDFRSPRVAAAQNHHVVISGCSGSGKSSVLAALARKGFRTFAEPGREIVKEQTSTGGTALPYVDPRAFGELCISRTTNRMIAVAKTRDYVFFDRGIIDPIAYFDYAGLDVPAHWLRAAELFRFSKRVFIVPPWPEIFENDAERTHSFEEAQAQYDGLVKTYARFGYETVLIPKAPVEERAKFVLRVLRSS